MRTPVPPRGTYRGRHHRAVLATFRPTWRQAFWGGLCLSAGAALALALTASVATITPSVVDRLIGTTLDANPLPGIAWLAALVPLPIGAVAGLALGRRFGTRLDERGVHGLPVARDKVAPWSLVADVRAERWRRRTVVAVYLCDGSILRLRAPYDGELLGRDPEFERKLFMICHLWETHRNWPREHMTK